MAGLQPAAPRGREENRHLFRVSVAARGDRPIGLPRLSREAPGQPEWRPVMNLREEHSHCWLGEPCALNRPDECPPTLAARKRDKGAPWSALVVERECSGLRHYLEGKPVHCGTGLVLQSHEYRDDDYGEYTRALQQGNRVRYEASIGDQQIRATLHADVGGHEFVAPLKAWMRFRWPK